MIKETHRRFALTAAWLVLALLISGPLAHAQPTSPAGPADTQYGPTDHSTGRACNVKPPPGGQPERSWPRRRCPPR